MASSSASTGMDTAALKTALYDACVPFAQEVFNQSILFGLGVIREGDLNTLLTVTQGLVDEKLFKVVHSEGLGWKLRSREEAKKLDAPCSDMQCDRA
jgi:DNA-directed RNA polymerase III subunit RPC6